MQLSKQKRTRKSNRKQMSRHTKAKKKKEKKLLKQKAKIQEELAKEKERFDVLMLLKTEHLDTKPNMAKFLKERVSSIRSLNWSKIDFYPEFKYDVHKLSVRFLDGHELICDKTQQDNEGKYSMFYEVDEVAIKQKDYAPIAQFFTYLEQFKFFY